MRFMRKLACIFVLAAACKDDPAPPAFPDDREPCARTSAQKDVYFGDLHVHTGYSFDAWVFDIRTTPEDAYRFARGEPIALPPLDESGRGTQTLQLDRPLDFVAVTDHAEYLGEVETCSVPGFEGHESRTCEKYRDQDDDIVTRFGLALTEVPPSRFTDVCGADRQRCRAVANDVWGRVQSAAESAYDRKSTCEFTSFVAYEYTGVTNASNLHRNVIFRNARVPAFAASYFEFPRPDQLHSILTRSCLDADDGCDVISIPHNTNWSNGNLFKVEYFGAKTIEEERAAAERRRDLEPLLEIYQHKGDMECINGISGILGSPDELCDFEKLRRVPELDCEDGTGFGGAGGVGCISRLDFLRGILLEGMKEERRLGVNPYALGVIASTDSHNGTPGAVDESAFLGHWGRNEDSPQKRLGRGRITPGGVIFSAGGLTAVWAEENSRNAIFDALKRREVYGTSGPRLAVRMYAAGELDVGLCEDPAFVQKAQRAATPMGGTLNGPMTGMSIVVSALMDAGSARRPGRPLERIQIVKGWLDEAGGAHVKVFDVAGAAVPDESLDVTTCESSAAGASSLCTVWRDPEFSPSAPAYYYARVLELPSCRWSTLACNAIPEDARPGSCTDPAVPKRIRERAWTSPLWYTP